MIGQTELNRAALLVDGDTRAAQVLGVSLDYLAGLTDHPTSSVNLAEALGSVTRPDRVPGIILQPAGEEPNLPATRSVPAVERVATAGGGTRVGDETAVGHAWFRCDWLDDKGLDPMRRCITKDRGESVEWTLPDRCSIQVNGNRSRR